MNAKSFFLTTMLASTFLATISGCSESTKEAAPLPELISPVNFPYIESNSLYSFNPETGESVKIFTSAKELIVALDTDESTKSTDDDNNTLIFNHSAKAEYFAYATLQTLHIFDINTGIDHQLYDFTKDIMLDPASNEFVISPESYICDIQKIVTWDKESRLAKRVLYKDELSLYVKTSTNEECLDTETPFSYWQINIEESNETLSRRIKTLLEHSHEHRHFHDHDDDDYEFSDIHNHTHNLEENEPDENQNPFKQNDHLHSHSHSHDFLYEDEHEHDHLTKNEIDATHNNPKNQEIKFETYPKLIGKKTTIESIDESLMYSGKPVLDIANRKFGYLGFNTVENSLKFYKVEDPDVKNLEKKLLWQLTNSSFNTIENNHSGLSDIKKLIPRYNRFSNFEYAEEDIFIITNNKILFFPLIDLFDDDRLVDIKASISNPLFTSNIAVPKLNDRASYNKDIKKMAITENTSIWSIDFSTNSPSNANRVAQLNETNLIKLSSTYIANASILIEKSFNTNDIKQNSIVILEDTGLESQTVLPKTLDSTSTAVIDNYVLMNLTDSDTLVKKAKYFTPQLGSPPPFDQSVWGSSGVDYRDNNENTIISIISSETNPNEVNSISSPKLYLFNNDAILGQGEDFGYIPQNIIGVNEIVIFTDLYGLVEVINTDSSSSTYFFSNIKSSFNFDNEYKNMKLLHQDTED